MNKKKHFPLLQTLSTNTQKYKKTTGTNLSIILTNIHLDSDGI